MKKIANHPTVHTRALLSTVWIFVLLNMLFRDIHELFRPTLIEQMMSGTVNGVPMTEGLILVAGIMLQLPLLMVVLSRVLPYTINRWANISIALITVLTIVANGVRDSDDVLFAAVEIVALLVIVIVAWKLPKKIQGAV